jgi:hypothetical protein
MSTNCLYLRVHILNISKLRIRLMNKPDEEAKPTEPVNPDKPDAKLERVFMSKDKGRKAIKKPKMVKV